MEEIVWVEILSRRHDVVARHRFAADTIRIGRGYDNDVVLDDPFAAAHHAVVSVDATGQIIVSDTGSINGLFIGNENTKRDRVIHDGEKPVRIGQTFIRVRRGNHVVAPERAVYSSMRIWIAAVVVLLVVLGLEFLSLWAGETAEAKLSRYVMAPLVIILVALAWTALWAVLGRVVVGRSWFSRNLLIAASGILVYSIYDEIVSILSYGLATVTIDHYAYVGAWCILGALIAAHLRLNGVVRHRWIGPIAGGIVVLAILVQGVSNGDIGSNTRARQFSTTLLPPGMRLAPLKDKTAFLANTAQLRAKVDRDRADTPHIGSGDDD